MSATVTVVPHIMSSGTPVEIRVRTVCPVANNTPVEFAFSRSSGSLDLNAFSNQIPRSFTRGDNNELVFRFTVAPVGLNGAAAHLRADIIATTLPANQRKTVSSPWVDVVIQGDEAPLPGAQACRPTITLNALPTAVIGGAMVPVDIGFSCALDTEAVVQIISSNPALVPNPPGGTVRVPANTTRHQVQLQAARTGSGSVNLRAVMSMPAGGMSAPDSVIVQGD